MRQAVSCTGAPARALKCTDRNFKRRRERRHPERRLGRCLGRAAVEGRLRGVIPGPHPSTAPVIVPTGSAQDAFLWRHWKNRMYSV